MFVSKRNYHHINKEVIPSLMDQGDLELTTLYSRSQQNQTELRSSPDMYGFNNLVQDLIEAMSEEDVKKIKRRFEGIIPQTVQTGEQIVDSLRENKYIAEDNIVYLQQIVRVLNKKDLLRKTILYASKCSEKILHFREISTNIREGFTYIKIHVEGHMCVTHDDAKKLLQKVSDIVQLPLEDVSIAGVEATSSVVITILLPDMYAEVLYELLGNTEKHYLFDSLIEFRVDEITVFGKCFKINGHGKDFKVSELSRKEAGGLNIKLESMEVEHKQHTAEYSEHVNQAGYQPAGTKRKYAAAFHEETDEKRKKLVEERKLIEHLDKKYRKPEMLEYIIMNDQINLINTKMKQLATMSTTVRKMISQIPKHPEPKTKHLNQTPEEINNQSLFAKLRRIYPTPYIQKRKTDQISKNSQ